MSENRDDEVLSGAWVRWMRSHATFSNLLAGESPRGASALSRAYLESIVEEVLLHHALDTPSNRQLVGRGIGELKAKLN